MLEFNVLGSLRVVEDGVDVTPPGDLQRRLLTALLFGAGRPVSPDRLAEELWCDDLPANHVAALQTQVFRLRKRLPSLEISRVPAGYCVAVEDHRLDATEFESFVTSGFACAAEKPAEAIALFDRALALWRGEPFQELESDSALAARRRYEEIYLRATDERVEIRLAAGEAAAVVAELEADALAHPTRERVHLQLARALSATGRAVDAMRVFDRFRRTLGDELGVEPSPEFQAVHDGIVAGTQTTAGEVHTARNHVPRYPTPLIGREAAVAGLVRIAANERLVTILGTGGVGKTRLAAEAAGRLAEHFDDVYWCDLASSSAANVLDAVAAQLGIQTRLGEEIEERIVQGLGRGSSLVVLDNCEHVIERAAALAERLVTATDRIHVLATSRERLAISGEHLVPVEPLSVGSDAGDPDAGAAVDLFIQRAAATNATVGRDAESRAVVAELCARLGGLPLAIELAAAQLFTMDLDVILREITKGVGVLSGQRRPSDRHRSLTAAMQWSYDLLTDEARRCFASVAVFRAPFTNEAAAAVLDRDVDDAHAQLRALAERSLLRRTEGRWLMLEPLRQFAADAWNDPVELGHVRARHARYHVERAERLHLGQRTEEAGEAMRDVDRELPDLRAAHAHFAEHDDAESLYRLVYALKDYGICRPCYEVLTWGRAAINITPDDIRSADMLAMVAFSWWGQGDREQFGEWVALAHQECERLAGPGAVTAEIADCLGLRALSMGQLDDSVHWYGIAKSMMDDADPLRASEIAVTMVLASAYAGDARAPEMAEGLLEAFGSGIGTAATAWAWYGAGEAYIDTDPALAMPRLQRSVELATACEAMFIAGVAGASLASLEVRIGDARRAVDLYRWLMPLWTRSGDTSVVWTAMRSIAQLLFRLGDVEHSALLLQAVRSTSEGHELFGADVVRLDALECSLRAAMGDAAFEAAARKGRGIDAPTLIEETLHCLAGHT